MKVNLKELEWVFVVWFTTIVNVMADFNSSDFIQKEVCQNSCRLILSPSDYKDCHCDPVDGNEPCQYGCQTIKCSCRGGKTCQVWCAGFSSDHGIMGCDCSRTWNLGPIPPSTTVSPSTSPPKTTYYRDTWRRQQPYYPSYTTPHVIHTGPGTSPAAIASIVATLVVVLIVVAILVAYVQRRLICQKRRPPAEGRGTTISLALIEPIRATRNECGYPVVSGRNPRFLQPAPTPSLPPSYEDSIRQTTAANNWENRAPDYVESPPPYATIGASGTQSRNVNESAV